MRAGKAAGAARALERERRRRVRAHARDGGGSVCCRWKSQPLRMPLPPPQLGLQSRRALDSTSWSGQRHRPALAGCARGTPCQGPSALRAIKTGVGFDVVVGSESALGRLRAGDAVSGAERVTCLSPATGSDPGWLRWLTQTGTTRSLQRRSSGELAAYAHARDGECGACCWWKSQPLRLPLLQLGLQSIPASQSGVGGRSPDRLPAFKGRFARGGDMSGADSNSGQMRLPLVEKHAARLRRRGPKRRAFGRVPHRARPVHKGRHPVHVTLRARHGLPSFRQQLVHALVLQVLRDQRRRAYRDSFQIVHFSIQTTISTSSSRRRTDRPIHRPRARETHCDRA